MIIRALTHSDAQPVQTPQLLPRHVQRTNRRSDRLRIRRYTVVPNNAPMPAVIAMARVPQNVTRNIPLRIGAPPV